jgi:hypothetical protein
LHIIPIWLDQTWWTEAHASWAEAFALILIFGLELLLAYFTLQEHKEARHERRQAEIARQRSEVTCAGVTSILRAMPEEKLCQHLWAGHFRHAGFAFEKELYGQLPEYLRTKAEPFRGEIEKMISPEQHRTARFLLVFRFPYPNFDAVLADVNRLNFGNIHLVWDDSGTPIQVPRN